MNHTLATAKRDFEVGFLKYWRAEKSPLGDGWNLFLGAGALSGYLCDARNKQPRIFKSADGLLSTVESIGFKVLHFDE